jgi:hypothetical protein
VATRTRFKPYKPYQVPQPPAGSFDPALNAGVGAANRGYGDLRQDTALAGARAGQDYQFGQDTYNQGFARQQEDYNTSLAMMKRQFDILAGQQQSQAAGQNVLSGGALLQSAAKRAANQALQKQGLDTQLRRAQQDRDMGLGRLSVDFSRGDADRTMQLARAGRENTAFGLDTQSQMAFQAAQSGYAPPKPGEPGGMPKGEFTNRNGVQRRRIVRGGVEYIVAPDGTVVSHRRVR